MSRLVYEHEGREIEVKLENGPVSVGRAGEADHQLPTPSASRIHAQFFQRDSGWWVEDLQSSNGTGVNGRKISGAVELATGDVISVGTIQFKFDGGEPKGPPDSKTARLLFHPGEGKPPIEVLVRDRVTIGRNASNTLQIDSRAVSGSHCEVSNRDGKYILRDLKSSNGTFVENRRVTEHTLRNGETVLVGKSAQVYFIDPTASESTAPESEPAAQPSASEPGVFSPVKPLPTSPPARPPLQKALAGLVLGALFVLAGWLLGDVIFEMRKPRTAPVSGHRAVPPLADAAFSFEGDVDSQGNPEGWSARIEAENGADAELFSDPDEPYDGRRSLRVSAPSHATLVLDTQKARPIQLGAECRVAVHVKAQGAQQLSLALCVMGVAGDPQTIAVGSFNDLSSTDWKRLEWSGLVPASLPENGNYRLIVCGKFSRLWLDRLEIGGTGADAAPLPFQRVEEAELALTADAGMPVRAILSNQHSRAVFTPLLLATDNEVISELELWATRRSHGRGAEYTALLPRKGDAAQVSVQAQRVEAELFPAVGVGLDWSLTESSAAKSLAVEIDLPLPEGATVLIADRRGAPIVVNRDELHTYAYSTISELMVNDTDLALLFPDGAVLSLDFSVGGRVIVTARAALDTSRTQLRVSTFTRPMMFARLYQRLYDEAMRMWAAEHGSGAKARLEYLTHPNRPHRELAVIQNAVRELERLEEARLDLLRSLEEAWTAVESTRTPQTVAAAERALLRYRRAWPGETGTAAMDNRARQIGIWRAEMAARARTPEERLQAEADAKRLWADAEQSHNDGNVLLALMLLDNVIRDYAETSVYRNALVLRERIQEQLNNAEERDRIIDEELALIDEDIKFNEYARARARCLALFKRFPDTPRNRDIMRRLRQTEDAFND